MSSHKARKKARRRVEKQMDQAFEAVAEGNLVLAEKLARRALEDGHVNPRIWNDHGQILLSCGHPKEAEEAFRTAIALAPTYGEAFQNLARLQAENGKLVQAVRLQQRAVELLPEDPQARQALRSFEAILPPSASPSASTAASATASATASAAAAAAAATAASAGTAPEQEAGGGGAGAEPPPTFTARTERYDWSELADQLRRHGMARLPALLDSRECRQLIDLDQDDDNFEHEVSEDRQEFGRLRYRFFARPLPELVAALRQEVYARLAPIVNGWQQLLGRRLRYPATLPEFLVQCGEVGQHRTTPILLRYAQGGFNAPHQDIAGRLFFPLQLAVTLGPGSSSADGGGEFLLVDQRPGKKGRAHRLATDVGDGVVFCTRERLQEVAGALGLQPVQHGIDVVRSPLRYALGLPFHEHG